VAGQVHRAHHAVRSHSGWSVDGHVVYVVPVPSHVFSPVGNELVACSSVPSSEAHRPANATEDASTWSSALSGSACPRSPRASRRHGFERFRFIDDLDARRYQRRMTNLFPRERRSPLSRATPRSIESKRKTTLVLGYRPLRKPLLSYSLANTWVWARSRRISAWASRFE
jgi:hypothetical protein